MVEWSWRLTGPQLPAECQWSHLRAKYRSTNKRPDKHSLPCVSTWHGRSQFWSNLRSESWWAKIIFLRRRLSNLSILISFCLRLAGDCIIFRGNSLVYYSGECRTQFPLSFCLVGVPQNPKLALWIGNSLLSMSCAIIYCGILIIIRFGCMHRVSDLCSHVWWKFMQ